MIDEKSADSISNYESWLKYAQSKLSDQVIEWPTMQKMVTTLKQKTIEMKQVHDLLRDLFLPNVISLVKMTDANLSKANYLAAEGALLSVAASTFRIPSPLIHRLLLERVASIDRHPIPSLPLPFLYTNKGRMIDTVKMLSRAIECFNPAVIRQPMQLHARNTECQVLEIN